MSLILVQAEWSVQSAEKCISKSTRSVDIDARLVTGFRNSTASTDVDGARIDARISIRMRSAAKLDLCIKLILCN